MRALIVAKKEFVDIITSKRFMALLFAMVVFFLMSVLQTLSASRISMGTAIGFFGSSGIAFVGGIFGIALGFDMITREKESGTLRILLTHPLFRDEIIIGKAIGAFLAICLASFVTMLFMVGAITMRYTPSFEEILSLAKLTLATNAYLFTFFSIAFLVSAMVKNSSTSLAITIGIFIVLALMIPMFSSVIAQSLAGQPPEEPFDLMRNQNFRNASDPRWVSYMEEMRSYREKVQSITSTISVFSPVSSYTTIVGSLTQSTVFRTVDITKNILSLLIIPAVLFGIAYFRFTREEL